MSLSTLLEAAKYLDYLDSNNHQNNNNNNQQQQQQQQQLQFQSSSQPTNAKKSTRRSRFSKKNAANTMLAMSLPTSSGPMQMHSVPIPLNSSGGESHQATSLSSSFTTGSPLSSFASTALFCSKPSEVTSASSSAASSLSSSDSSSSCGEILMGDNDFNQSVGSNVAIKIGNNHQLNNNHHNYHLVGQQQQFETNHQTSDQKATIHKFIASTSGGNNQSIARYIAATSSGPQLVTMTTSSASLASTSAPVDGNIRAGHVIHAANAGALINASPGTSFDQMHGFSLGASPARGGGGMHHHHNGGHSFNIGPGSFISDNHLSGGSPTSCPPLIMARVQPMILNSMSPSAHHHSIMAFQPATASSPTSSSSSYSRHRELHKTLEKNRRAHLRHCFELLKAELPASECVDKKTSHINIIRSAIRYVLTLRQQEVEIDNELQRLTKIKNELTENLSKMHIAQPMQQDQQLTSTSSLALLKIEDGQRQQQQREFKKELPQSPAPEQQLSFLLSRSKID